MKKSWSVILKSFKMHFNDQKCIHKEVKGEAATEKCILHSTPVMLYFSVFCLLLVDYLLNCIDYICPLMLVTQIHFLRTTKYERWPATFSQLLTYQKRAVWSIIWLTTNYVFFCDMLRWKWKCQYPRKQTSRSCF